MTTSHPNWTESGKTPSIRSGQLAVTGYSFHGYIQQFGKLQHAVMTREVLAVDCLQHSDQLPKYGQCVFVCCRHSMYNDIGANGWCMWYGQQDRISLYGPTAPLMYSMWLFAGALLALFGKVKVEVGLSWCW